MKCKLYVLRCKKTRFNARKGQFRCTGGRRSYSLAKANVCTEREALNVLAFEELGIYAGCFELVQVDIRLVEK